MIPLQFKTQSGISKKLSIREDSLKADFYGDYRETWYKRAEIFIEINTTSKEIFPIDLTHFRIIEPPGLQFKINSYFVEGITAVHISVPRSEMPSEKI